MTSEELYYALNTRLYDILPVVKDYYNGAYEKYTDKMGIITNNTTVPIYYKNVMSAVRSAVKGYKNYPFVLLKDLHINAKENRDMYYALIDHVSKGLYIEDFEIKLVQDTNFYGSTVAVLAFIPKNADKNYYIVHIDNNILYDIQANCSKETVQKILKQIKNIN